MGELQYVRFLYTITFMSNRHLARSVVLQTLFECDLSGILAAAELDREHVETALRRNVLEFAPGITDVTFCLDLLFNIITKRETLDEIIVKAAPDWPLEKISNVDRNILRMGLFELLFSPRDQVPPKVAIDEAIELAKTYGGETSGRFVNGVLGAIYKEMGEPEKNQSSKTKKEPIDPSLLPQETLGGAVVFSRDEAGTVRLAFVHDIFGHWTLSKGHLDPNEEENLGTAKRVGEEFGITVTVQQKLGENAYIASTPDKGKIRKNVVYYLAEVPYAPLQFVATGGLDDARWFELSEVANLNIYDDILPIVTKAIVEITK